MARRHGRGVSGISGALLGWAWAHKLAGLSPTRHLATLKGACAGLLSRAPKLHGIEPDGSHWKHLIGLRFRRFGARSLRVASATRTR
jgi:hypothetical protein